MKKYIIGIFAILFLMTSCSEDQIELYSGPASINIGILNEKENVDTTGVIAFGFIEDTFIDLNIKLYLSGFAEDRDRTISLIIEGDNIASENDYEIPTTVTLPAGKVDTRATFRIKRDATLNGTSKALRVKVVSNENFKPSVMNRIYVSFSDEVPSNWLNVQYNLGNSYLGACSKVKYLFLYDVCGIYDFSPYSYTFVQQVGVYMRNMLNEYNSNPEAFEKKFNITPGKYGPAPMLDENGGEVKYV